jgi:hypothetical protein
MNPIEVQMLSSLSPTGQLTINPMTGQKEAFLPFLAPLLGSFLGNAALGSTLAGALGSKALGAAAAGALGSAAATTAVTGDLEQGIMSGITGFGIGSALGGLGELAKAGSAAAETAAQGAQAASGAAGNALPDVLSESFRITPEALTSGNIPAGANVLRDTLTIGPEGFSAAAATPATSVLTNQPMISSVGGGMGSAIQPSPPTFMESLAQPFQQPGQFIGELAKPGSFLPMYVGETGRMAREQELMGRGSMRAYEEEQEAERQKTLGQIGGVYDRIRAAYPGVGYAQGGMIDRYAVGGGIENAIRQAAINAGYGGEYGDFSGSLPYNIPDPKSVQLSLRGSQFVPPPASSYSALDVGGEGYLAGMAPEFQYFREPPPPPTGYVPSPPGTVAGGGGTPGGGGTEGFNFEDFLSGFRGLQNIYGRPGGAVDTGAGPVAGREPVGTGITEPTGPEDGMMYLGGSKKFDETAGARARGELDTTLLEDLLNQQANTPTGGGYPSRDEFYGNTQTLSQTEPEIFAANPPLTQPEFPDFTGINMADLEQRLAELTQSQNAPVATENTTQYDPTREAQTFETPQVTFDTQSVYTQPETPVSRPAIQTRFEPEPEVTRGIGAFRAPEETPYTPPEVYRSPQPVQMEPEPVYQQPAYQAPEPVYQEPVAPPPAPAPPVRETPVAMRQPVSEEPVARTFVARTPEPFYEPPALRPQPTGEPPIAQAPIAPAPVVPPSLEEFIRNAGGELAAGLDRLPLATPAAPMPVAPPPVAVPAFDPQLLEQLIAMSRSPEALPQEDMGFGGAADFGGPVGDFGVSDFFAEGGMVNETDNAMGQENSIVDMTVAAIRGEIDNADQIIRRFVEMYGPEVFMQLREQVLQEIVPGAQTNGMVEGEGGGQDDLVNGMIGTQRPVAVSPGEYIIPADVVSLAGGGYSGDGAKYFDSLIDDIRQKTMGTTEQIRPYRSA